MIAKPQANIRIAIAVSAQSESVGTAVGVVEPGDAVTEPDTKERYGLQLKRSACAGFDRSRLTVPPPEGSGSTGNRNCLFAPGLPLNKSVVNER